jgi:hypothetical protein
LVAAETKMVQIARMGLIAAKVAMKRVLPQALSAQKG